MDGKAEIMRFKHGSLIAKVTHKGTTQVSATSANQQNLPKWAPTSAISDAKAKQNVSDLEMKAF